MVTARRSAHFAIERLGKFTVVRQPSERIMPGLIADLLFALLARGDVDSRGDASHNLSGRAAQRSDVHFKKTFVAAVLELRAHTLQGIGVLRNGGSVWILAVQKFVQRL